MAIGKLKSGKAGNASGILPEMLKAASCEVDFLSMLLDEVHAVWRENKVSNLIQCWSQYLRKGICPTVTIGGG